MITNDPVFIIIGLIFTFIPYPMAYAITKLIDDKHILKRQKSKYVRITKKINKKHKKS